MRFVQINLARASLLSLIFGVCLLSAAAGAQESPKREEARAVFSEEAARSKGISGSVILRGLLAADGKVKQIIALLMLPDGLTEKAMEAMRQIKFTPATKDGRPVSVWVTVEYGFQVY